ncbi:MAG: glycerate kinase [Deltaproteobacteria bacterium]|nr:glycerate kinase [Deltaproteobacteria bacterium]
MALSARERAKKNAREIFLSGVEAASPYAAVKERLRVIARKNSARLKINGLSLNLNDFKNIYIAGAGKGVCPMARAVEETLGGRLTRGCVVTKHGHGERLGKVEVIEASHPIPDKSGVNAAKKILSLASNAGPDGLVIFLLSGGASALLCAPAPGITLDDKRRTTRLLINSGAAIGEINAVRKHLSMIKGGGLARAAFPAAVITLIVSDVVGDDISTIGSGPTAPDPAAFSGCIEILKRYGLLERTPARVLKRLKDGEAGRLPETPKPGDSAFQNCRNFIVAGNGAALGAARKTALSLGYRTLLLSSTLTGPTHAAAGFLSSILKEIKKTGNPVRPPACLLAGGETTLEVRGRGKGGRNQELALVAALGLEGAEGITLLSAGTDGTDGPTDAAGAFAFSDTIRRAKSTGLDAQKYLADNDSHRFFKKLNDLLVTGPTGTNVMDMVVGLVD